MSTSQRIMSMEMLQAFLILLGNLSNLIDRSNGESLTENYFLLLRFVE